MLHFFGTCNFDGCVRTLRLRSDRARRWGKFPAKVKMRSRGRKTSVDHSSTKGIDAPSIICSSSEPSSVDQNKSNILVRRGAGCPGRVPAYLGRHLSIIFDVDPVQSNAREYPTKRVLYVFIDSSAMKSTHQFPK
jgi:hypothetical protein